MGNDTQHDHQELFDRLRDLETNFAVHLEKCKGREKKVDELLDQLKRMDRAVGLYEKQFSQQKGGWIAISIIAILLSNVVTIGISVAALVIK